MATTRSTADWLIRCPGCGKAAPAARTGAVLVGKWAPFGSHTLGYCRTCRRLRVLTLIRAERADDGGAGAVSGE